MEYYNLKPTFQSQTNREKINRLGTDKAKSKTLSADTPKSTKSIPQRHFALRKKNQDSTPIAPISLVPQEEYFNTFPQHGKRRTKAKLGSQSMTRKPISKQP